MINEIQHTAVQHDNITTTASRGQGGSRFEPQPKGYGMSQNHHFECPQATFDSQYLQVKIGPFQRACASSPLRDFASNKRLVSSMPELRFRQTRILGPQTEKRRKHGHRYTYFEAVKLRMAPVLFVCYRLLCLHEQHFSIQGELFR